MPDTINTIVPEGTPTIYRAGRRAFMPDTINIIVPKGTPTKVRPAGRFLPLLQPDESPIQSCLKALLPFIVLVGGHSCPIQLGVDW